MSEYSILLALCGGLLIGLASIMLMGSLGRVMGLSGILHQTTQNIRQGWRPAFLIGTLSAPILYTYTTGNSVEVEITYSLPLLIVGGLLVGFGTNLGSGCTSGHGICGLGRLSLRSLVAVITFMTTAILTVFILGTGGV